MLRMPASDRELPVVTVREFCSSATCYADWTSHLEHAMIDSSQTLTESRIDDDIVSGAPAFYVVSRKKLAILYLATFGLYGVYWVSVFPTPC